MEEKPAVYYSSNASQEVVQSSYIKPQARKPYDPDVTFEEYHYYANKTREEESTYEPPKLSLRDLGGKKPPDSGEKPHLSETDFADENRLHISDEEWTNASRAFRSASWGACKYKYSRIIRSLGPR